MLFRTSTATDETARAPYRPLRRAKTASRTTAPEPRVPEASRMVQHGLTRMRVRLDATDWRGTSRTATGIDRQGWRGTRRGSLFTAR
ncbi:hypothetical protein [Luteococcus sp.]|uniref:hypothetical protein n=1 Tax=Luteococcus sp. TaxID=1969402 RepID=UPI003736376F